MAEKSGSLSVAGITKYKRITKEIIKISYHIVQLQVPPDFHIVVGK